MAKHSNDPDGAATSDPRLNLLLKAQKVSSDLELLLDDIYWGLFGQSVESEGTETAVPDLGSKILKAGKLMLELERLLARVASLPLLSKPRSRRSASFHSATGSKGSVPVAVRVSFPEVSGAKRRRAVVTVDGFTFKTSALHGHIIVLLCDSSVGRPLDGRLAGQMRSIEALLGNLESRLGGVPISKHYLQVAIDRIRKELGKFNLGHLLESSRGGYRLHGIVDP